MDVIVDLETLGQVPGCAIISIGAVFMDLKRRQLGPEFYVVVNTNSCQLAGLHEDDETKAWGAEQAPAAKAVLKLAAQRRTSTMLTEALDEFAGFLGANAPLDQVRVW